MIEEQTTKIYCANCIHCKLMRNVTDEGKYLLRVRCSAGKWRKKLGDEKYYKYFTVVRRSLTHCDSYSSMGEPKSFMRELRESLPSRDEAYELPSSYA